MALSPVLEQDTYPLLSTGSSQEDRPNIIEKLLTRAKRIKSNKQTKTISSGLDMRVYVNISFLISQPKHMFKLKNKKKKIAHNFMIILFLHIWT